MGLPTSEICHSHSDSPCQAICMALHMTNSLDLGHPITCCLWHFAASTALLLLVDISGLRTYVRTYVLAYSSVLQLHTMYVNA